LEVRTGTYGERKNSDGKDEFEWLIKKEDRSLAVGGVECPSGLEAAGLCYDRILGCRGREPVGRSPSSNPASAISIFFLPSPFPRPALCVREKDASANRRDTFYAFCRCQRSVSRINERF
jgi:hypothetical protein